MSVVAKPAISKVKYPSSDGERMSENTLQYEWIVTIRENLDLLLPEAFVAGDLLWYPVEGDNRTRRAPDVLVAFGRPKGHRSSYMQWQEAGQAPDVVIEVWSPGNTYAELMRKLKWYDRHGVREFIMWDPDRVDLIAWQRSDAGDLDVVSTVDGYESPYLGCTFTLTDDSLEVVGPDGVRFRTVAEMDADRRAAEARADAAESRAARLEALLRAHGIEPGAPSDASGATSP